MSKFAYDLPIQNLEHAEYCLAEAAERYGGDIIIDEYGMFLVQDADGWTHTDDVLRALSPRHGKACRCVGCKRDIHELGHYYMVHDHVWATAGNPEGMLCLDCLERRIGRELCLNDFCETNKQDAFNLEFWEGQDRMLPRAWATYRRQYHLPL